MIPHMIRPYNRCCCITEPVISRHCVHLKLGLRFHALSKKSALIVTIFPLEDLLHSFFCRLYILVKKTFFCRIIWQIVLKIAPWTEIFQGKFKTSKSQTTADLGPKFRGAKCSVEGRICERKTFLVGFVCFVGLDDNTWFSMKVQW